MSVPGKGRRVLYLDMAMTEPDHHASSVRALQLMTMLRDWGWEIDFLNWYQSEPPRPTTALDRIGVRALPRAEMPTVEAVERFLLQHARDYDLIYVAWVLLGRRLVPLAREAAPDRPVLYDSHDVNHLREFREARISGNARTLARAIKTKEGEILAVSRAHATLAITDTDAEKLRELVPGARIFTVGMWSEPVASERRPEPRTLLFLGNMGAPHNHDCALYLDREVMPLLARELPGTRLLLAGPPHNGVALQVTHPATEVVGWVPDIAPLYAKATAVLAPLRFGSGLKGKMLTAMGHGVPVVASDIAAEGMPLTDGEDVLLANDPAAILRQVRRLFEEPALGARLAAAAQATLRRHYGRPVMERAFAAALEAIL